MSEESATPVAEENPEVKPGDVVNNCQVREVTSKERELMMLEEEIIEDEKMPSYMDATSISISTKPDDSRIEGDEQTQPQSVEPPEDKEREDGVSEGNKSNSSVVELSSGEESGKDYDGMEDDDDEEEEEEEDDYSSDEMDYDDEEEVMMRHHVDDEEEDSDGELEAEQFERSSDDYVLRPADNLDSPTKERSRSLQDLSIPNRRTAKFNSKRHFTGVSLLEMDGRSDFHLGGQRRSSLGGHRYSHVPSKVKQYIHGIKEQSRLSKQRRAKDPLDVNEEFDNLIKRDQNLETDIRVNPQSRFVKNFMENSMKHMVVEDAERVEDMPIDRHLVVENGADIIAVDTGENLEELSETTHMEIDKRNVEVHVDHRNHQIDLSKQNGLIDYNQVATDVVTQETKEIESQAKKDELLTNGTDEVQKIINCQSMSHEDFMKGNFDNFKIPETATSERNSAAGHRQNIEDISLVPSGLKFHPGDVPQVEDVVVSEENKKSSSNSQLACLKAQLDQKVVECNDIKEDYKQAVNKNFQLKNELQVMSKQNANLLNELEALKKALLEAEQKNKVKKMKTTEVQTEEVPAMLFDKNAVAQLKANENKVSGSSIASAPSSMEQWTDSNCSPSISLKPPNVGSILNSDDSFCLGSGTPRKATHRPLSQAFYTSSRILQTLANITQGKADPANANIGPRRTNIAGQSKEPISPLVTGEFGSRKRKASESQGTSAVGPQPFKMPFLSSEYKRRFNSNYETDGDSSNSKTAATTAPIGQQSRKESTSQNNDGNDMDKINADESETNDGIKCFVYKEDPNSKEKSFLLQAEEPSGVERNGLVRECGPFLLANLEVRMSEANGTLNIWGREVSRDTTSEDVEEDLEEDLPEGTDLWPKTPCDKLKANQFVCSTNKKFKPSTPQSSLRSRFPRKLRTMLNRVSGQVDDQFDRPFGSMPNLETASAANCANCPSCSNQKQKIHSPKPRNPCCSRNQGISECECEQMAVQQSCVLHNIGCRPVSFSNPANLNINKHACMQTGDACKHHIPHVDNEDGCCHIPKRCHSVDIPCNSRAENNCSRGRVHSVDNHSVFMADNVPFLASEKSSETPENTRRRLSGKRVRGILRDFLKGCGDCRHSQTDSFEASHLQESNSNTFPDIRITPAQNQSESAANCDSRLPNSMADFQLQFQQLMSDVEKINIRSKSLFQMMNTLCQLERE